MTPRCMHRSIFSGGQYVDSFFREGVARQHRQWRLPEHFSTEDRKSRQRVLNICELTLAVDIRGAL
jgi:hypothetical protein